MPYTQYSTRSSGGGKLAHALVMICFVSAILLYAISTADGVAFPALFQLGTIILLALGTYFLIRYILKQYIYEIHENQDQKLDLVVTEVIGKKLTVVVRVALEDIATVSVVPTRQQKRNSKAVSKTKGEKCIVYKYDNRLTAPNKCLISIPKESTIIQIPDDQTLVDILKKNNK